MADYINREAVIALTDQHCFETSYDAVWMEEELRKLPSADVVARDCYDRLAAYEDAGLTPEEIEELLAFAKFVAREAIDTGDNDGVSAEILCRKLNKLGLIETDGEFWMLPTPPKEDSYD